MITVGNIMKEHVVSVHPTANVRDAFAQMCAAEVRHLPIVDERGHLVGIVSQRDLLRALDLMRAADGSRHVTLVGDVMKAEVLKVPRSLPAHEAAAMMIENKIGALPVVATDGRVVGILTETDFVEVARESLLGIAPTARAHG
jgi:CBS domain-containing protein